MLESIGDAFFSVDREWIIQYWNHEAEQVLQKSKNEIIGKNLWEVFETAVGSISYHQYNEALLTGESRHFEDRYAALNKWYDVSAYPSERGLSVFFKDITERKLAERELQKQAEALEISRRHYSDLFQLSPLPKFVFDTKTLAYLDVNRAAVNHYGYSREEFLSMTLRDIRPETELHLLEEAIQEANHKTYFYQPGTFIHRKKNGELINVEITSSAIEFDGKKARIALAVDVTKQIRHLESIQIQNQQLRDIAWMQSHTIRAPLSRIMGLIELLKNTTSDPEEITEILAYIQSSAIELDTVIHSISVNAKESES
nr:PAS domain S-box protein [Pedobacter sp. JY14-1]